MPLLEQIPCFGPGDDFFRVAEPGWRVLQVRARTEKEFVRKNRRLQVGYFLPMFIKTWRQRGRTLRSQLALLPGYVFVSADADQWDAVLRTNSAVRTVPVADRELLSEQVASLYAVLCGGTDPRVESRLAVGTAVRIVSGPFAGVTGRITDSGPGLRISVEISLLGCAVSVAAERWMVESVPAVAPVGAGAPVGA